MAKKEKNSFVLYYDQCESAFEDLDDEELARLWRDIEAYSHYGVLPKYPPRTLLLTHFRAMAASEDRNTEKYNARCETNRQNQNSRWQKEKYNRIQSNTNDTDSDSDNENDTDTENESVSECDSGDAVNRPKRMDPYYEPECINSPDKLYPFSADQNVMLSLNQLDALRERCFKGQPQLLEFFEKVSRKIALEGSSNHFETCMEYMDKWPAEYRSRDK